MDLGKTIAIALALSAILVVRTAFGIVATLMLAVGCFALASVGPKWLLRSALYLLAVLNCAYAASDLTGVLYLSHGDTVTDAALMARATGIPAILWAALWLGLGILALVLVGKRLLRR